MEYYELYTSIYRHIAMDDECVACNYMTGMIKISSNNSYALFDSGTIHSFISTNFIKRNNKLSPISLEHDLYVFTPSRDVILVNLVCKNCILSIEDREMKADLLVLKMKDFDLILRMD